MSSYDLPIILVSAADNITASKVISELIDNEVQDDIYKESGWRVWKLDNKYYEACVRLQVLPDNDATAHATPLRAEAHLLCLSENEGAAEAEVRRARASPLLRRGAVRLALLDARAASAALVTWATGARYELVTLREAEAEETEAEEDETGKEDKGVPRARAALHAHVWPGLRRHGAARAHHPERPATDDEESSDGGSVGEEDEESAVERAEAFAEALGLLGALAEQRATAPDEHRALRRERAEQLVAAFCRALGHDLQPR